jgi:sugar phosphate isomerase/epimerase
MTALPLAACGAAIAAGAHAGGAQRRAATAFKIALNQWSLFSGYVGDTSGDNWWGEFAQLLRTDPGKVLKGSLDPMGFPRLARETYGLGAIEVEASLYYAHVRNAAYFKTFKQRCDDHGVQCLFVSNVYGGNLGAVDGRKPAEIAANYYPWVDVAATLGCHSLLVDVNARRGDKTAIKAAAVDGLSVLTEFARKSNITIITENHGGYSSDAAWLVDIVRGVNSAFCRLNVDLGNFCRAWDGNHGCIDQQYDPYAGVQLMMPLAKAVSAKTMVFDERGEDTRTDYARMLRIIRDSGFDGYLGVEYAGDQYPADKGIRMTIDLIHRSAARL